MDDRVANNMVSTTHHRVKRSHFGPLTAEIPRWETEDHPLCRWERGWRGDRLDWRRHPDAMLGLLSLPGTIAAVTLLILNGWCPALPPTAVSIVSPAGIVLWWKHRCGQRYNMLRRTGVLQELYLAGQPPLVTYAAFDAGNDISWGMLGLMLPYLLLITALGVGGALISGVIAVGVGLAIWLHRKRRWKRVSLSDATWFLLARGPVEAAFRFLPELIFASGFIVHVLSHGVPALEFGGIGMYILGLAGKALIHERTVKLDLAQVEDLLRCHATGEEWEPPKKR